MDEHPLTSPGGIELDGARLIDSHCHLDYAGLADRLPEVLARARAAGVARVVTIATHVGRHETYRALAEAEPGVFWTVGTHPHHAAEEPDVDAAAIAALAAHPRCIAIGETGLDYHYDRSPGDVQRRVLRTHIAAAQMTGLPLVIHAREADADLIDILGDALGQGRFEAVLHCFSSTAALAAFGIANGFYVSFSGILTFRRSHELRAIAETVPADRMLVETDAPYLAPEPHRGRPNEPAWVVPTAAALAAVRGVSLAKIARQTTANFYRLFRRAAVIDDAAAAGGGAA